MVERVRSRSTAVALGVLLFVIYNANQRVIHIDDSVPARLLPFSLLVDHSLYLDHWVKPYVEHAHGPYGVYFAARSRGHWVSPYPIVTPVLITPLYVAPALWLSRQSPPLIPGDIVFTALVDLMEKLSASLIAALSAVILYLVLCRVVSRCASVAIALAYAIASSTWTISSQALWKQSVAELGFAFTLWALVHEAEGRENLWPPFWAGVGLAVTAANSPPDAVVALVLAVYFGRQSWRRLAVFAAPLVVLGALSFAYNFYFFGNPLGTYPAFVTAANHPAGFYVRTSPWDALGGLLVSPSRGLFIYVPWAIFAVWGAARVWKENLYGWGRYLIIGLVLVFLGYTKYAAWWGGWCYGPRYLTNLMPFLAFFLVPVWPRITAKRVLAGTFGVAFAAAVAIQAAGAFCYPGGWWDAVPVSVDKAPARLWDWRDTQIVRTSKAGPARPQLYDDLYLVLGAGRGVAPDLCP